MTVPSTGSGQRDESLTTEATAWLVRMRSDPVTAADRQAFEQWLADDPLHREVYVEVLALWDVLGELPDPRLESYRNAQGKPVRHRIEIGEHRRPYLRRLGVLAACLLPIVMLSLWVLGNYDRLRADHVTGVGETATIRLADGSVVQLNTDTALSVGIAPERRRVSLYRGEAFFAVASPTNQPFEVAAGDGLVRVHGTELNVRDTGDALLVAVAKGRVQVSAEAARDRWPNGVILGPGEAAHYRTGEDTITKGAVDVAALAAWREGRMVFADRPLNEVIAEIDRYRSGMILLLDSTITEERFTGVLNLRDTDQALAAIESTLPLKMIHITHYLVLLRS